MAAIDRGAGGYDGPAMLGQALWVTMVTQIPSSNEGGTIGHREDEELRKVNGLKCYTTIPILQCTKYHKIPRNSYVEPLLSHVWKEGQKP
jgi:hypothetical protein